MDVNCLLGHWPFRKLYKNTFDDLIQVHRDNNINSGFVASLNAVFYNDPFEGDEELHEWIKGSPYKHVLTVNPELPGWEKDIETGLARFGICGVRVYPIYHGYDLSSGSIKRLCGTMKQYNLPLFLTVRMEDERLDYLLKPPPLPIDALRRFLMSEPDLRIVLLNIRYAELMQLQAELNSHPHVVFDTSGLKDGLFVVEKLLTHFPAEKLMYGSQYPLYCLKSTHLLVAKAEIDEAAKERIMGGAFMNPSPI